MTFDRSTFVNAVSNNVTPVRLASSRLQRLKIVSIRDARRRSARHKWDPVRRARSRSASVRSASSKLAPLRSASLSLALVIFARDRFALVMIAPFNVATVSRVPIREALVRDARVKSLPINEAVSSSANSKFAPSRSAPSRTASVSLVWDKSAPPSTSPLRFKRVRSGVMLLLLRRQAFHSWTPSLICLTCSRLAIGKCATCALSSIQNYFGGKQCLAQGYIGELLRLCSSLPTWRSIGACRAHSAAQLPSAFQHHARQSFRAAGEGPGEEPRLLCRPHRPDRQ